MNEATSCVIGVPVVSASIRWFVVMMGEVNLVELANVPGRKRVDCRPQKLPPSELVWHAQDVPVGNKRKEARQRKASSHRVEK